MEKQYFGYIRVSTVKQNDGASLDAQREAIATYASSNDLNIAQWFEETETAAKQGRPVFAQMIKRLQSGKGAGVIMHKIDRSARNFKDWATIHELQDAGIAVHFAAESLDFTSRGGRLTADIQAVFAADYIRNLKEEIRKGQTGRLKQGLYPFSAPFGYTDAGKGNPKAVDPVLGPCVRDMFNLYATGQYSLPSLVDELERRGYRTKTGHKIYKGKIEQILANPFYMGIISLKNHPTPYDGAHEPLITPTLFAKVQRVKANRNHRKRTKHNHLYRGLFACQICTNAMIPERQKGHVYYRCHTKPCPSNSIRQEALDWAVLKSLSQVCLTPDQTQQRKEKLLQDVDTGPSAASLQLVKLEHNLERLTQGYLDGVFDAETYKQRKSDYQFRKLNLTKQVQTERSAEQKAQDRAKFLEHVQSLARTYFYANDAEKRQVLDLVFSNRFVEDKKVAFSKRSWVNQVLNEDGSPLGAAVGVENRRNGQLPVSENDPDKNGENHELLTEFNNLLNTINARQAKLDLPKITIGPEYFEAVSKRRRLRRPQ